MPAEGMIAVQQRIAALQPAAPATVATTPSSAAFARALAGVGGAGTDLTSALAPRAVDGRGLQSSPTGRFAVAANLGAPGTSAAPRGGDVVARGARYLGVPYRWGGTDPATGLDCSGFVQRVYRDLGVELPRVSRDQARTGQPVESIAQARPGDIVAFGEPVNHVGIYAGNGTMIHAPHSGSSVRFERVYETPSAIRRIDESIDRRPLGAQRGSESTLAPLFADAEERYGLPRGVLTAVARAESGFDANAVSRAGAQGLMQLMPATARGLGVDPFDPPQAIDGAARLLASNLEAFGSLELALAAYNAGGGAVSRYGGVPPFAETRNYVRRVTDELAGAAS